MSNEIFKTEDILGCLECPVSGTEKRCGSINMSDSRCDGR